MGEDSEHFVLLGHEDPLEGWCIFIAEHALPTQTQILQRRQTPRVNSFGASRICLPFFLASGAISSALFRFGKGATLRFWLVRI